MKILEYKVHEFFREYGLPCISGNVVSSIEELKKIKGKIDYPVVLKAQVHTGGRGKAGGIQFASNDAELIEKGKDLFKLKIKNLPVKQIFIPQMIDINSEMYLSFVLDRKYKKTVMIYSREGGMEINEIAEKYPDKVAKLIINPAEGLDDELIQTVIDKTNLESEYHSEFKDICRKLYQIFIEKDCLLAEINPLIIDSNNKVLALDGKVDIDDNSLYRHENERKYRDLVEVNNLILKARKLDFLYIPISDEGNIAIISNGSGMIMSSIDLIVKSGMTVACALDLGGGATADRIQESLRIISSNPDVDTIFINIFGGITRCDEIAKGVRNVVSRIGNVKLIIRLEGTNKKEGIEILENAGGSLKLADGLRDGIEILVQEMNK